MSFTVDNNRRAYTADGVETEFEFPFRIHSSDDITVYVGSVETSDFTVEFVSTTEGGTVILDDAPAADTQVLILRIIDLKQDFIDLELLSRLDEPQLEKGYDRNAMMSIQLEEQLKRAPKFDIYSTVDDIGIDDPVPLQYLRWNDDGTRIESVEFDPDLSALDAAVAAAEASAAAAAESALLGGLDEDSYTISAAVPTAIAGESYDAADYRQIDFIASIKQGTTIVVRHDFSLIAINGTWTLVDGDRRYAANNHTVSFTISQVAGVVQLLAEKGGAGNADVTFKKLFFGA